jgi:hypothetical protein
MDAANGCETSLRTLTDCGMCRRTCDLAGASESCATGACVVVACSAGFGDCDGDPGDGCEPLSTFYRDADGDGFGDPAVPPVQSCTAPAGYVAPSTDCDDRDRSVFPGAAEVCNLYDDDCDATPDEGLTGCGLTCAMPFVVTRSGMFVGDTCGAPNNGNGGCSVPSSPDHVYVVRLTATRTVRVEVADLGGLKSEADILHRGTSCPGADVRCVAHDGALTLSLPAGDHYFLIEHDHAMCLDYRVTFTIT